VKSETASKMLSCVIMISMAASFVVIFTGCLPPATIKKLQPTMGHWVYEKDPETGAQHRVGCVAGGTECAFVALGCTRVDIPVSLAEQLIKWQASTAQL
jgi:hypothetical protein